MDPLSGGLKLGPRRLSLHIGGQSEPISVEARNHVEMSVEDRLVGGFAVEVEEVDAVAAKAAGSQCLRHSLGDVEHVSTGPGIDVGQSLHVCSGNDQCVPGRDRVDIEKNNQGVILVEERGVGVASDDLAEDAVFVNHNYLSRVGSTLTRRAIWMTTGATLRARLPTVPERQR